MNLKRSITALLLAFVLISIGYAVGKEVTLRRLGSRGAAAQLAQDKLTVLYLHSSIRCVTCNAMEKMTREVLDADFAEEMRAGRIEFRIDDFQENDAIARKYDIRASNVVLVRIRDGEEQQFRRLDELWELASSPARFKDHVRQAIRQQLGGAP